jgi:surface polysaccharide O-acyltransferase-like enzyme
MAPRKNEDVLPDDAKARKRIVSFDYIRTTVIILVLLHHAVLAYTTFAFLNPTNPIDTFSPVVDSQRWSGFGTAGPLWFLWLLLAFNVLIVVLYRIAPHLGGSIISRLSSLFNRPLAFFGVLFGITTVAYLPLVLLFGFDHWTTIGPITFQTSRILLYLAYFLVGTAIGVYGIDRTMFNSKNTFASRGWIGMVVSPVSFFVMLIFLVNPTGLIFYGIAFTFTCAAAVLGFIAIFLRFTKQHKGIIDSLSDNSFGIYIIHYVIVIWLQFWLLEIQLPAILKASIVFLGTLILSWGIIAAIRRIPVVARVI